MAIKTANSTIEQILSAISATRLEDEQACLTRLKVAAENINYNHFEAAEIARTYIQNFRKNTGNIGLEEFFRQYALDTNEGLAVMSLAEALLRIPDAYTANLFIHD